MKGMARIMMEVQGMGVRMQVIRLKMQRNCGKNKGVGIEMRHKKSEGGRGKSQRTCFCLKLYFM